MRLGPFQLNRTVEAAAAPPAPPRPRGASGTINLQGYLQSTEYLPELRGLRGLQTIDQMLRSDGAVQEAVEHIISPVKNAKWTITPASDEPDALAQAAFIRCAYFNHLSSPWLESLDEQLDYLLYGHAVFELELKISEEALYYEDPDNGERVDLPARQFVTLDAFAPRLQPTIWKWLGSGGRLDAVVQRVWVDDERGYEEIEIPAEQLLLLTNKRRGDDWTGRSILRSAYKHWYLKQMIEKIEAVSLDRWGVGIAVGYPPDANDSAALDRIEDILVNLRAGEFTYIASPGPKATSNRPGYVWEILSPTGTPPDFTNPINRHRGDIKAAVLARFAELGHASVGARATGDVQAVVWFAALHAAANYVCEAHRSVIKRLIDLNYPGVTEYPKLTVTDIEIRNLAEYATAISMLHTSGAITHDPRTEDAIRGDVDLPPAQEMTEPPPEPMVEPEHQAGDPMQNGQPPPQRPTQPAYQGGQ